MGERERNKRDIGGERERERKNEGECESERKFNPFIKCSYLETSVAIDIVSNS